MARFIGTPEDFYDLFGSNLLTKAVQTYTKEYREMVRHCTHKGLGDIECSDTLHAAHVKGTSRKSITMDILRPKCDANGEVNIDIEEFLEEFYQAHIPLHKHFIILCSKHHGAYDKGEREMNFETRDKIYGMPKEKQLADTMISRNNIVEFLPTEEELLSGLKENGICYVHYHLADGTIVTKPWNNKRAEITKDNLMSNITSKDFFCDYRNRIAKVVVSLDNEI